MNKRLKKPMNKQDKQDLELVIYRLDQQDKKIDDLKSSMDVAHTKNEESLRFIKENLFNPHEGLWAETRLNTEFRKSTSKWRGVIGTGFIGLMAKHIWDMFKLS